MIEFVLGIIVHGIQNNAQNAIIPNTEMQMAVQTSFKTLLIFVIMLPFFSSSSDMFWTVVPNLINQAINNVHFTFHGNCGEPIHH